VQNKLPPKNQKGVLMEFFIDLSLLFYDIGSVVALIVCIAVVIIVTIVSIRGQSGFVGGYFIGALFAGFLTVAPLIYANENLKGVCPTSSFPLKFWISFSLITIVLVIIIITTFSEKEKPNWLERIVMILLLPLALLPAGWMACTLDVMGVFFTDGQIDILHILQKILIGVLGVIYLLCYFILPVMGYSGLGKIFDDKKKSSKVSRKRTGKKNRKKSSEKG
jgi:hypothetical protein